jgi:hypothetical protein
MSKQPISVEFLDAINDAIFVLAKRGHKDAAAQLEAIWEQEFAAGEVPAVAA